MKYTFEITIAGCSTNCEHCYVNGGPAPIMPLDDYHFCIEIMSKILHTLSGNISLTLGNELFCHPDIEHIIRYTHAVLPDYYSYSNFPVPTTGIALISKTNRDKILEALHEAGADSLFLAIHGSEMSHNRVVHNHYGYQKLIETARWATKNGFKAYFNLIVSKILCNEFFDIADVMTQFPTANARLTIPIYVPNPRMRKYESIRAEKSDCQALIRKASELGIDTTALSYAVSNFNEEAIYQHMTNKLNVGGSIDDSSPQWAFFNVTQTLDLYYGNVGAHTKYLGNLKHTDTDLLLTRICELPSNYSFSGYYSSDAHARFMDTISGYPQPITKRVYPSREDCIFSWMDQSGIPNIIEQ